MIKLISIANVEIGTLLYDKHIPRTGEIIISDDLSYRVAEVIYDDDSGNVLIKVELKVNARYANPRFPKELSDEVTENTRRLALEDGRLAAVKYYKEAMGIGLKEAKDYVDSLT